MWPLITRNNQFSQPAALILQAAMRCSFSSVNGKQGLLAPALIHRVWELHVLDTSGYNDDCSVLFGGDLITHSPDHDDPVDYIVDALMVAATEAAGEGSGSGAAAEPEEEHEGGDESEWARRVRLTKIAYVSRFGRLPAGVNVGTTAAEANAAWSYGPDDVWSLDSLRNGNDDDHVAAAVRLHLKLKFT